MYAEKGSICTTYLQELNPDLQKSENGNNQTYNFLSDTIDVLNNSSKALQLIDAISEKSKGNEKSHLKKLRELIATERAENNEAVALLQEPIESLKQQLDEKEVEVQELQQELSYANQELCAALSSASLTIDDSKQLEEKVLATDNPHRVNVSEVISTIDSYIEKSTDELKQIEKSTSLTPLPSDRQEPSLSNAEFLKARWTLLIEQTAQLQACSKIIIKQAGELKARSRKLQYQINGRRSQVASLKAELIADQSRCSQI
jgi:DNA repair exonuclease SbcCD ATPase subunit